MNDVHTGIHCLPRPLDRPLIKAQDLYLALTSNTYLDRQKGQGPHIFYPPKHPQTPPPQCTGGVQEVYPWHPPENPPKNPLALPRPHR